MSAFDEFTRLESEIAQQYGAFSLFAVVRLEAQELNLWDLVVSATWATSQDQLVEVLANRISATFSDAALLQLARIFPVPADDPGVRRLLAEYPVEHGRVEVREPEFLGLPITRAYIITARPAQPAVAA